MPHIPAQLRQVVRERARNCCEYCHLPEAVTLVTFHIEHIIAEQHGGPTLLDNLALACPWCNLNKGPNIATLDPNQPYDTATIVALFNPRQDHWADHFTLEGPLILPVSIRGHASMVLLRMNSIDLIVARRLALNSGYDLK